LPTPCSRSVSSSPSSSTSYILCFILIAQFTTSTRNAIFCPQNPLHSTRLSTCRTDGRRIARCAATSRPRKRSLRRFGRTSLPASQCTGCRLRASLQGGESVRLRSGRGTNGRTAVDGARHGDRDVATVGVGLPLWLRALDPAAVEHIVKDLVRLAAGGRARTGQSSSPLPADARSAPLDAGVLCGEEVVLLAARGAAVRFARGGIRAGAAREDVVCACAGSLALVSQLDDKSLSGSHTWAVEGARYAVLGQAGVTRAEAAIDAGRASSQCSAERVGRRTHQDVTPARVASVQVAVSSP